MIELELIRRREQWARSFSSSGGGGWLFGFIGSVVDTPVLYDINHLAYGGGKFVGIGNGNIIYSYNGINWFNVPNLIKIEWGSICYAADKGMWVVVGAFSGIIMISYNGIDWINITTDFEEMSIHSITYGNGMFVGVGHGGAFIHSYSGLSWTMNTMGNNDWQSVTYGNGMFVAVANGLPINGRIATSTNGTSWAIRTTTIPISFKSIIYANSMFVAGGQETSTTTNPIIATSTNGTTWTTISNPNGSVGMVHSIAYGGGKFVAQVGVAGIITSTNGTTWTNPINPTPAVKSIVYGGGKFVARAVGGIATSTNGTSWSYSATQADRTHWKSVAYGDGKFIAVSDSGDKRIMLSEDLGITWQHKTSPQQNEWKSVAYGNGMFVAVSQSGGNYIMASLDGINWDVVSGFQAGTWQSVCYSEDKGLFVAVADSGTNRVMTSETGLDWVLRSSPSALWQSVAYGNGTFVAVARSGTNRIMVSTDGISWALTTPPSGLTEYYSITYGGIRFVIVGKAIGNNTRIATSVSGTSWSTHATPYTPNQFTDIIYGNGMFVATSGDSNSLNCLISTNGTSWSMIRTPYGGNSITYGGGRFVTVGNSLPQYSTIPPTP